MSSQTRFSLAEFWGAIQGNPLRTFLICLAGITLSTTDQALFSYAIPGILEEFSIDLQVIGQILSVSFLVATFAVVIAGILTDRWGRRRMFVVVLAGSAVFVGLQAIAETLTWLAVFRALGFAISAGIYPIATTIMVEVAPARYRGLSAGWLQIGYPIGFGIAALIAAPLIGIYGWRAIFLPAFAVVPLAFLLGKLLRETNRFNEAKAKRDTEQQGPIAELFGPVYRRRTISCFVGSLFISHAIGGIIYFVPTFFVQERALSQETAALLTGLSYVLGGAGYILVAYVGEFVTTRRNTLILCAWAGAVAFMLTIWFAHTPAWLVIGFAFSVMFAFGTEAVRMPMISELFPTRMRATATVIPGAMGVTVAYLIAPISVTYGAAEMGWTMAFTFLAVLPLLIGGAVFLTLHNVKSGLEIEAVSG